MAFGFFKKKVTADCIYRNGTVLTLDPDFPEAGAIAVKNGSIIALGDADEMENLVAGDTEIIDLEGATVVPGFFTAESTIVRDVFSHFAHAIDPNNDLLDDLRGYIKNHPKYKIYCAFGFAPDFDFGSLPRKMLDTLTDKPLILLSEGGDLLTANTAAIDLVHRTLWAETVAAQKERGIKMVPLGNNSAADAVLRTKTEEGIDVEAAAEDEEDEIRGHFDPETGILSIPVTKENPWPLFRDVLPGFQFYHRDENKALTGLIEGAATVSQFLNLLDLFDSEEIAKAIAKEGCKLAKQGYTAVLDSGAPDYFVRAFLSSAISLIESNTLPVRIVLTNLISRKTDTYLSLQRIEQRQTLCTDCSGLISADHVRFLVRSREDGTPSNASAADPAETVSAAKASPDADFLAEYAASTGEHGFDILAVAEGKAAFDAVLEGIGNAHESARKALMVAKLNGLDELSEEEKTALLTDYDTAGIPVMGTPKTTGQKLNVLAARCARLLRNYDAYGSLAVGGPADFTVLARNPLEQEEDPLSVPVLYTVLDGFTVSTNPYDYPVQTFADDFGEEGAEL